MTFEDNSRKGTGGCDAVTVTTIVIRVAWSRAYLIDVTPTTNRFLVPNFQVGHGPTTFISFSF
jgi:hypothetical protein